MLITLVIILLLIGAAVVGSIYSNFLIFYSNFNESENYHRAYYNSISALERAELVVKQRSPGYEGSGGWILGDEQGPGSDKLITNNFSYLSDESTRNKSSVYRTINSKTDRIPSTGQGDIEFMLATGDSTDYNKMDYSDTQVFLLYYDPSSGNAYNKVSCPTDCIQSQMDKISGTIRLPKKLFGNFGILNTSSGSLTTAQTKNDVIVNRQLRGKYHTGSTDYPFTIYSFSDLRNGHINTKDSTIRESDINESLNFIFGQDSRAPTQRSNPNDKKANIISSQETEIRDNATSNKFNHILENNDFRNKELRFSLLNLLKTESGNVYPFLEYYAVFGTGVADKYFKINAEGNYDDYKINKIIWKPTNKESILGSFTTIF